MILELNGVSKMSLYDNEAWDSSERGLFVVGDVDGVVRLTESGTAVEVLAVGGWPLLTPDLIGTGMNDLKFLC
jgi:hypothetical protein